VPYNNIPLQIKIQSVMDPHNNVSVIITNFHTK
jgi:hypothetical protein